MLDTLNFRQDVIVTVPNASELVESGMFFAGDGEEYSDFPTIQDQVKHCLNRKYNECSEAFIKNCLRDGIQFPVLFYLYEKNLYSSVNGHHRLAIAWKHNIVFPAIFATSWEKADRHDPNPGDVIMWSTQQRDQSYGLRV